MTVLLKMTLQHDIILFLQRFTNVYETNIPTIYWIAGGQNLLKGEMENNKLNNMMDIYFLTYNHTCSNATFILAILLLTSPISDHLCNYNCDKQTREWHAK